MSRIASMDSSFADAMNPQVFTISTSACAGSFVSSYPCSRSSPSAVSLSTRFLLHPSEIIPTLSFVIAFSLPLMGGTQGALPLDPTRGLASGLHKGLRPLTLFAIQLVTRSNFFRVFIHSSPTLSPVSTSYGKDQYQECALRRFPKGDRKALWSRPQTRNPRIAKRGYGEKSQIPLSSILPRKSAFEKPENSPNSLPSASWCIKIGLQKRIWHACSPADFIPPQSQWHCNCPLPRRSAVHLDAGERGLGGA